MTKTEWDKLKLQVILRGHPGHEIVFKETGWCNKCLHNRKCGVGEAAFKNRLKKRIRIPIYDEQGIVAQESWWTCWEPVEFDEEK